ncbi:endo-1,4-beta-xylanase 5-like [Malania oleifera]|uniref:endo-1,4-beta-xylanase 5-like n=1 Tax=Malania oleifera TaxID=397392 RepID=UPI0025AE83D6|nr:endo-1,4-beta-xylanase 5-like [Malania oleifera]
MSVATVPVSFQGMSFQEFSLQEISLQECLEKPNKAQYNGGIVRNPEFNEGLEGWSLFGGAGKIEQREAAGGQKFIVAYERKHPYDSFSQNFSLIKDTHYTFSGAVMAESGCWSMLKGGISVDSSGPAELYFESKDTSVEIRAASVSLQPFTNEQWTFHQHQSIEKMRKNKVRLQAVDAKGNPLPGANISFIQKKLGFPFGNAINRNILTNPAFQKWFTSRFTVTTFENEMKWYSTEATLGKEDYSVPDAMLQFARRNGISVRGHAVFWDDPQYQQQWIKSLAPVQLAAAANRRMNSLMTRYAGKVIGWDVVNENLRFSFFEDRLGKDASAKFYNRAFQLDKGVPMFLNDYNTIEMSSDVVSSPSNYLKKLREIQAFPGNRNGKMGIGLESHFTTAPNLPYIRSAIDTLAAARVPIWITELDVQNNLDQAKVLEQVLREVHAHPAIKGIVMWASWTPQGCYRMCLTDNNFRNLATGAVVDKLIAEWSQKRFVAKTDAEGFFEAPLFHGDYQVTIASHAAAANLSSSSTSQTFKVQAAKRTSQKTTLHVKVSA